MARSGAPPDPPAAVPDLELDVRARERPKPKRKRETQAETPLELAVDTQALVVERLDASRAAAPAFPMGSPAHPALVAPVEAGGPDGPSDACVLANFGEPPKHWILSPTYAWRVLRRRRALTIALVARRSEAVDAVKHWENALEAFSTHARASAQKTASYAPAIEELERAEAVLRSRDSLLAEEREAHKVRLYLADERISTLEAQVAQSATEPRSRAATLYADAQRKADLARSERNSLEQWLKRQADVRTSAVEEARKHAKNLGIALAKSAMLDRTAFGKEFDPARQEITKLEAAAGSVQRDVILHEEAVESYDGRSLRRGLLMGAALVLVLIVIPIVWRATRVVEPPPVHVGTVQ